MPKAHTWHWVGCGTFVGLSACAWPWHIPLHTAQLAAHICHVQLICTSYVARLEVVSHDCRVGGAQELLSF